MRAFCRCRQKGVKKAEIKAEINRSALAGEPDPLERWLMALWVPLGLRKLGKDEFQISYFFPCKEFFRSMRAIIKKKNCVIECVHLVSGKIQICILKYKFVFGLHKTKYNFVFQNTNFS